MSWHPSRTLLVIALAALPTLAVGKDKGLAGTDQRRNYCAEKFGRCIGEGNQDCTDTYVKPHHIGVCMEKNMESCSEKYGRPARESQSAVEPDSVSAMIAFTFM